MNIKSILLAFILIIGVATTATTQACCPRGCGRFSPFHINILYNSYYSTINGIIVAVTAQEQVIIKTSIGFITVPYNFFINFSDLEIGRKIKIITKTLTNRIKRIVIVGVIRQRKKTFFNHPIYCNIYRYKKNVWIMRHSFHKKRNKIYWSIW